MFGTRAYTEGALYQVPRKIPVRIEPKTYFGAAPALEGERLASHLRSLRVHAQPDIVRSFVMNDLNSRAYDWTTVTVRPPFVTRGARHHGRCQPAKLGRDPGAVHTDDYTLWRCQRAVLAPLPGMSGCRPCPPSD